MMLSFLFFEAEDGIRDGHVTGVQTCALPISEKRHAQQLWSDLMGCFDIASERIDVFERNADRASTGGRGYIDFFWSGEIGRASCRERVGMRGGAVSREKGK